MKQNKRIVGTLLALALLLGALFVASPLISAEPAATVGSGWSGYVQWVLTDDGVMRVYGDGAMKNYTTKNGMPWYPYADQIEAVIVEDGVTSIGSYAFYGMPALKTVEMADSVTSVGDYAFKNCSALEQTNLPSALSNLGDSAFYACTSLESIEIPASLYTVKPYAFKNCTSLAEVILHEGNLMKLSDGAFYGCTSLTQIEFPACLDIIDGYCFKGCSKLSSITIPEGDLAQIREAVFYGSAIPTITIPEGVTSIKPYAFKNCTRLVSVDLPESLTSVGEASFYACTALESLDLPDAVTEIGNYAFRKCSALESVRFSGELEDIGESSFYGCESLTEIVIPDSTSVIQGYAFKGCTALTDVDLGEGVKTLGESSFYGCTALEHITIPASVTKIDGYCFSRSTAINSVTFLGDAPAIGSGTFNQVTADAYYPTDNATWTAAVMLNYGGKLTWKAASSPVVTTYTVTFVDYDGTILAERTVAEGGDAEAPSAPAKSGCEFLGWTGTYANVTRDETVRAVYSDEKNVIVIQSVSGTAGGTATVLVEITGEVKTCGFDFCIFFDPALELTAYDNDLHLDVVFNNNAYENGVALNFSATTDKVKPREIVELIFQIDENADGALPMTLQMTSIKEMDGSRIVDTEYVLVNGIVSVE